MSIIIKKRPRFSRPCWPSSSYCRFSPCRIGASSEFQKMEKLIDGLDICDTIKTRDHNGYYSSPWIWTDYQRDHVFHLFERLPFVRYELDEYHYMAKNMVLDSDREKWIYEYLNEKKIYREKSMAVLLFTLPFIVYSFFSISALL